MVIWMICRRCGLTGMAEGPCKQAASCAYMDVYGERFDGIRRCRSLWSGSKKSIVAKAGCSLSKGGIEEKAQDCCALEGRRNDHQSEILS